MACLPVWTTRPLGGQLLLLASQKEKAGGCLIQTRECMNSTQGGGTPVGPFGSNPLISVLEHHSWCVRAKVFTLSTYTFFVSTWNTELPMRHCALVRFTPGDRWLAQNKSSSKDCEESQVLASCQGSIMIMAAISSQAENSHHGGTETAWYITNQAQLQWVAAHWPPCLHSTMLAIGLSETQSRQSTC